MDVSSEKLGREVSHGGQRSAAQPAAGSSSEAVGRLVTAQAGEGNGWLLPESCIAKWRWSLWAQCVMRTWQCWNLAIFWSWWGAKGFTLLQVKSTTIYSTTCQCIPGEVNFAQTYKWIPPIQLIRESAGLVNQPVGSSPVRTSSAITTCSCLGWSAVSGTGRAQSRMTSVERGGPCPSSGIVKRSTMNHTNCPKFCWFDSMSQNHRNKLYLAGILTSEIRHSEGSAKLLIENWRINVFYTPFPPS